MKRFVKPLLTFAGFVLVLGLALVLAREPRNDRPWAEEVAKTATATLAGDGSAVLRNVRDFTYGDRTIISRAWRAEVPLDTNKIVRAWFVLEPFSAWKAVGHTYLTFEFGDGSAYSFSVEARKQKDQSYSAFLGLFNAYELAYSWGTERDFLTRRVLYLDHPVYIYPMKITPKEAQAIFKTLLVKTNDLAAHPRFYNTLTANCTNVLAEIVNGIKPGAIPRDVSWYLPGHSDRFLARIGYLVVPGDFKAAREKYLVSAHRSEMLFHARDPAFTAYVRSLLPPVPPA